VKAPSSGARCPMMPARCPMWKSQRTGEHNNHQTPTTGGFDGLVRIEGSHCYAAPGS
jgi:hypothetical protein